MDEQELKLAAKYIRKVRACLKRLQSNSDNLKDLLTLQEMADLALVLSTWDKHVNGKINK